MKKYINFGAKLLGIEGFDGVDDDFDEDVDESLDDDLDVSDDDVDSLEDDASGMERAESGRNVSFGAKMCPTRHGCQGATNCDYAYGNYPG